MKRILIYGDSLTWGRIAEKTERFDESTRFTKVLQSELGSEYEVIEEGLRGRMAGGENPHFPHRDGYQQFPGIFLSQLPLDLAVIFLGTNDCSKESNKSTKKIVKHLQSYIPLMQELSPSLGFNAPKILFIAPPHIQEKYLKNDSMFVGGEKKSKQLVSLIKEMCEENKVEFFDSNEVVETCEVDGVHLSGASNIALGKNLAKKLSAVLK